MSRHSFPNPPSLHTRSNKVRLPPRHTPSRKNLKKIIKTPVPLIRRHVGFVASALVALLLNGCQASLFTAVNATASAVGLAVQRDVLYESVHGQSLDVYAPQVATDAPTVVFFYGGSWTSGKRQWYRWLGERLAQHGVVTVIPDYRKYPEVRMEGFMADAAHAVAWARGHAGEFGGDPQRLFVMGHSAGGHIGALLATDSSWLGSVSMQPRDLAGFIGLAGAYDFLPLTDEDFIGMFGHDAASQKRSQPVLQVDGDEPPMLLLHGDSDHTVEPRNASSLARAMRDNDEFVELHMYPDIGHITLLLSLSRPLQDKAPALEDTLDFIRQHAGGEPRRVADGAKQPLISR